MAVHGLMVAPSAMPGNGPTALSVMAHLAMRPSHSGGAMARSGGRLDPPRWMWAPPRRGHGGPRLRDGRAVGPLRRRRRRDLAARHAPARPRAAHRDRHRAAGDHPGRGQRDPPLLARGPHPLAGGGGHGARRARRRGRRQRGAEHVPGDGHLLQLLTAALLLLSSYRMARAAPAVPPDEPLAETDAPEAPARAAGGHRLGRAVRRRSASSPAACRACSASAAA